MHNLFSVVKTSLKRERKIELLYQSQLEKNRGKQIQSWNWWREDALSSWLNDFISKRGLLDHSGKTVALCSVFGEREVLDRIKADVRVFFSGENVHHPHRARYADFMLSGKHPFDLGLGFDAFENERYLRFPLWLFYMFTPNATKEEIRKRCDELRHPVATERKKFCALVARTDLNGVRKALYDSVSELGHVDCPGLLFHNDDSLLERYQDDKVAYLRQFMFNICPENSASYGYTTEKLFQAVAAGCIPIYWGNDCLDIVNPSIVLFWNKVGDHQMLLDQMACLLADEARYHDFVAQDWLLLDAEEFVMGKFSELERKLGSLLQ